MHSFYNFVIEFLYSHIYNIGTKKNLYTQNFYIIFGSISTWKYLDLC